MSWVLALLLCFAAICSSTINCAVLNEENGYLLSVDNYHSRCQSGVDMPTQQQVFSRFHLFRIPKASSTTASVVARRFAACYPPGPCDVYPAVCGGYIVQGCFDHRGGHILLLKQSHEPSLMFLRYPPARISSAFFYKPPHNNVTRCLHQDQVVKSSMAALEHCFLNHIHNNVYSEVSVKMLNGYHAYYPIETCWRNCAVSFEIAAKSLLEDIAFSGLTESWVLSLIGMYAGVKNFNPPDKSDFFAPLDYENATRRQSNVDSSLVLTAALGYFQAHHKSCESNDRVSIIFTSPTDATLLHEAMKGSFDKISGLPLICVIPKSLAPLLTNFKDRVMLIESVLAIDDPYFTIDSMISDKFGSRHDDDDGFFGKKTNAERLHVNELIRLGQINESMIKPMLYMSIRDDEKHLIKSFKKFYFSEIRSNFYVKHLGRIKLSLAKEIILYELAVCRLCLILMSNGFFDNSSVEAEWKRKITVLDHNYDCKSMFNKYERDDDDRSFASVSNNLRFDKLSELIDLLDEGDVVQPSIHILFDVVVHHSHHSSLLTHRSSSWPHGMFLDMKEFAIMDYTPQQALKWERMCAPNQFVCPIGGRSN